MTGMKTKNTLKVSPSLNALFDQLPLEKSVAIEQALRYVIREPDVLAYAFRLRLTLSPEENTQKISYTIDKKVYEGLNDLTNRVRVGREEVVRLSMEAYIHRL